MDHERGLLGKEDEVPMSSWELQFSFPGRSPKCSVIYLITFIKNKYDKYIEASKKISESPQIKNVLKKFVISAKVIFF